MLILGAEKVATFQHRSYVKKKFHEKLVKIKKNKTSNADIRGGMLISNADKKNI